jgi:uncharacterized protein
VTGPVLYRCRVSHTRRTPVVESFVYRHFMWLIDLDAVPELPRPLRLLGTFDSRDHLDPDTATPHSIRSTLDAWLVTQGVTSTSRSAGGRVRMLTTARAFGHVFDPLSLYWCYRSDDRLECIVAEVHNTYGERHSYLLRTDAEGRVRQAKQFAVSPFFDVSGEYLMRVAEPGPRLQVTIALRLGDVTPFTATLSGQPEPNAAGRLRRAPRSIAAAALRHPFLLALSGYRVTVLIRYHGIRLLLRRVPLVRRRSHHRQEGVT